MENEMIHLAKITAQVLIQKGKILLTEELIIAAMNEAVAKESNMAYQILNSREKQESFARIISGMAWDKVHAA